MGKNHLGFRVRFYQFPREQDCRKIGDASTVAEEFVELETGVWFTLVIEFRFYGLEPVFVVEGVVEDCLPTVVELVDAEKFQSVRCC